MPKADDHGNEVPATNTPKPARGAAPYDKKFPRGGKGVRDIRSNKHGGRK